MTILPLSVLVYIPFVHASLSSLNGTIIPTLDVSDCPSYSNTRTLSDIIWSCAATLFACTWTAIHPNIPGIEEGKLTVTSRRLFIMVMALMAPELIITWSARQYFSARETAKEFNGTFGAHLAQVHGRQDSIGEESSITLLNVISRSESDEWGTSTSAPKAADRKFTEWTVTHGFFAWMGGFMLYVNGKPRASLTGEELHKYVCDGSAELPNIDEASIEDRSKGDVLSKAIGILQLAWFVTQLLARYAQNLPMTLLEIDTLAVAALTCIAYGWWWKKPKDLGHPYVVPWKGKSPECSDKLAYDEPDALLVSGKLSSYFHYLISPFQSLMGLPRISPRVVRSHRVPTLAGYTMKSKTLHHTIILLVGSTSGMVFGAIHCAGWNFFFERHVEQILWRASSLAVLGASLPISVCLGYENVQRHWPQSLPYLDNFLDIIIIISYFVYVGARITLFVLMFMSFRALPPGVYETVAWTKFIPHI